MKDRISLIVGVAALGLFFSGDGSPKDDSLLAILLMTAIYQFAIYYRKPRGYWYAALTGVLLIASMFMDGYLKEVLFVVYFFWLLFSSLSSVNDQQLS